MDKYFFGCFPVEEIEKKNNMCEKKNGAELVGLLPIFEHRLWVTIQLLYRDTEAGSGLGKEQCHDTKFVSWLECAEWLGNCVTIQ